MDRLFAPSSILVVGVSCSRMNMGRNIVDNLLRHQYRGRLFLLGQKPGFWAGHPILTEPDEIPVPSMLDLCGQKGITMAVVESGGFTELGPHRQQLEDEVREVAHRWGIRFVGPNGLGVMDAESGVVTPFAPIDTAIPRGRVSLLSQSGGVGMVTLFQMARQGLGMDKFVSMGNKFSLDEVDFLRYLTRTGTSDTVCCYLEGMNRPREFFEGVRRFPGRVILLKASVSRAGERAAGTHTASLATDDRLVDAGCRWSGTLRTHEIQTMVEAAKILAYPALRGRRLLIISRSGGHAVLAADHAERLGFELPDVPESIAGMAAEGARASVIRTNNPLDLGDIFDFDVYARMMEEAARCGQFDGAVLIQAFSGNGEMVSTSPMVRRLASFVKDAPIPLYFICLTEHEVLSRLQAEYPLPVFSSPEAFLKALALVADTPARPEPQGTPDGEHTAATGATDAELQALYDRGVKGSIPVAEDGHRSSGLSWLPVATAFELLAGVGIPVPAWRVVSVMSDALDAAREMGYPVVLKLLSPRAVHKARMGGVVLGISSADELRDAFARLEFLAASLGTPFVEGYLVQRQHSGGRELFLGARRDPQFGPVLLAGTGGTSVEKTAQVAAQLLPADPGDLETLIPGLPVVALLAGEVDAEFVCRCARGVARLVQRFPSIVDMDANPLQVNGPSRGGMAVDVRILLKS